MLQLNIIGTLHADITPDDELIAQIEKLQPDALIVEITQEAIDKNELDSFPSEMQAAYMWAKDNNIPVFGMDVDIDITKPGISEDSPEVQAHIAKAKKLIEQHSWQDFNKPEINKLLRDDDFINQEKFLERDRIMADNIRKNAKGKTVIITGCGHLEFFENEFPQAKFPLRES